MMQKDNNNAISEKLSQNDADVVTKRQASEIEKQAALIALGPLFEDFAPRPLDLLRHVGAVAGFYDMKIIPSSVEATFGGRFVRAELRGPRGSGTVTIEALP